MYKHKNGITFRKLELTDMPLLKHLKDESWFGTHAVTIVNLTDQERWFNSVTYNEHCLYLIAEDMAISGDSSLNRCSDTRIGLYKMSGIDWINRSYDSGYDVFDYSRGKGYGKKIVEAGIDFGFEILNMHRVDTEVLENNIASMKAILHGGFEKEGVRRGAVYKCGQWLNSVILGICYEDWEKLVRVNSYGRICNISYQPKDRK